MQDKLKYAINAHRTMGFRGEQAAADTRPRDVVTGEPIETWFSSRKRESGERVRVTAVIANMSGRQSHRVAKPGTEPCDRIGGMVRRFYSRSSHRRLG